MTSTPWHWLLFDRLRRARLASGLSVRKAAVAASVPKGFIQSVERCTAVRAPAARVARMVRAYGADMGSVLLEEATDYVPGPGYADAVRAALTELIAGYPGLLRDLANASGYADHAGLRYLVIDADELDLCRVWRVLAAASIEAERVRAVLLPPAGRLDDEEHEGGAASAD